MVQYLYENDYLLYTYAALCGLGLFLRFIVNMIFKRLVKQSEDLGKVKNKMLKYIKMKFEACYRLKIGVNNVDSFVDKNVLHYRFCGILLSTWENLCGQVLFLNLLIVPILGVFGVIYQCGQGDILFFGTVGIASSAVLIIVDKSLNLSMKKIIFRTNLIDYLENFCKIRLEQEAQSPELIEQHRKEYQQVLDMNKQVSATAPVQVTKENPKEELNRRREARRLKEEERKLQALKREEELKKAEEARKEEEKKRLEERKLQAAKRREEERLRLEEERKALEARRAQLKKKAQEMQYINIAKSEEEEKKPEISQVVQEDKLVEKEKLKEFLQPGLEEIAAVAEKPLKPDNVVTYPSGDRTKTKLASVQEDKLLEDVLKEFFS